MYAITHERKLFEMPRLAIVLYLAPIAPLAMALQQISHPVSPEFTAFSELAKTGIVGVFAAVLLWLYRTDRKESEARLAKMAEDYKIAIDKMHDAINYCRARHDN